MTASREHFHALDNLRAVMMWLGIVLHVGVIHMVRPVDNITYTDTATTLGADILVLAIHSFRIPVFFVLAGFFVALLAERYGTAGMLRHRLRRIGLPFALFWPVLFAATTVAIAVFHGLATTGQPWSDPLAIPTSPAGERVITFHLWFLYQLLGYCVLVAALTPLLRRLPARWRDAGSRLGARVAGRWWGLPVLVAAPALASLPYPKGIVVVAFSFLPQWTVWLYYGAFFAFGLLLYRHRAVLLATYQRRWRRLAVAGAISFGVSIVLADLALRAAGDAPVLDAVVAFTYPATAWLWAFALIGGFRAGLGKPRPLLGYLAGSAYWVYLVHLPLTILIGAAMYGLDWSPWLKMALNITATTAVCLVSYHYLVRGTAIGWLLNGRRQSRPPTATPAPSTAATDRA